MTDFSEFVGVVFGGIAIVAAMAAFGACCILLLTAAIFRFVERG